MQNSDSFINVLKTAMDDEGFRAALSLNLEGTLRMKNLQTMLKASEIEELKNIFEAKSDQVISNNLECAYRGYK